MSLEKFVELVRNYGSEGRIGVSKRIELFDLGKELGLRRNEVDKIIDEQLAIIKSEHRDSDEARPINIPEPPEVEVVFPEIEDVSIIIEDDTPHFQEKDEIEYDLPPDLELDTVEENQQSKSSKTLQHGDSSSDDTKDAVEDDKTTFQDSIDDIIKNLKKDTEDLFSKSSKKSSTVAQKKELQGSLYCLISGIAAFVLAFGFIGLIASGIGLNLATKCKQQLEREGNESFTESSINQYKVGQILCYVGLGFWIFRFVF